MGCFSIGKLCLPVAALLVVSSLRVSSQETGGGIFSLGISDDASVGFSWRANPESDVAGYRLYVGTASRVYAAYVDVGNVTQFRLTDLIRGMRYYFALTAYDSSGLESGFTPEVSSQIPLTPPPVPQVTETVITNLPPGFEPLPDLVLPEGTTNHSVLVLGINPGATGEVDVVTISASSSSPDLIPNPEVTQLNSEMTALITLQPVPGATGTATITVTADDGRGTNSVFSRSFSVRIERLNSPPTMSQIPDLWLLKNRLPPPIPFIIGDAESALEDLTVTVTSSSPDVLPDSGLTLAGSGAIRTLAIDPSNGRAGTSTVTLTVSDGSATASISFGVTIQNLLLPLLFGDAIEEFFK